jgi:hypothetical protein
VGLRIPDDRWPKLDGGLVGDVELDVGKLWEQW